MLHQQVPMANAGSFGVSIVGSSARAAAVSARRAGLLPWTADLFADSDLISQVPDARRCCFERYPEGLLDLLVTSPDQPFLYTGGLENHPELIEQMAECRPLWGNRGRSLRLARDPFWLQQLLSDNDLQMPRVAHWPDASGRWLCKPLAGSGGNGIAFATATHAHPGHYFQQYLAGESRSAVFMRDPLNTICLGMTRQLIGPIDWLNAPPFRYAGNITCPGPVPDEVVRLGRVMGDACELLGLFGIDFLWDGERPWLLEVNPRYTASIEVLERAFGQSAIALHAAAFTNHRVMAESPRSPRVVGKAILYARERFTMPEHPDPVRACLQRPHPTLADVPHAGEPSEPGWPILTVLADADSAESCEQALRQQVDQVRRWLQVDSA